jgi:hypothetical protein
LRTGRRGLHRRCARAAAAAVLALCAAAAAPGAARAAFPYAPGSADPKDYSTYRLPDGQPRPNDLNGKLEWMYAATPEPGNEPVNSNPFELNGVRGAHLVDASAAADTAWETTTGRPDVTIAVLDSGIKWNDRGAMVDLRRKTRINKGEAPKPRTGRGAPLEDGVDCSTYANEPADWDANRDGVFNVSDYACDPRVERDPAARAARGQPRGAGPADLLDPQDVLIAFSDGTDGDGNGFVDDLVGWDFLDDDNDPFDDVQYGHGTGEARDSTAEADNGGELGACPNCTSIHMRVGDSFIADVNRFAQAVLYAVDNDALVVQEALGTLNNSHLARRAVEYAYEHGVAVVASAADEAAQHHNWPSSYPHVIMVNSVTKYDPSLTAPGGRSYLQFNGCTNFMANVTLAIPSVSCSSDATGRGSGMAGLVYSAALNARDQGRLDPHPHCRRASGKACVITANEVRQLMASGTFDGTLQADDVNFLSRPGMPEPSCNPPLPGCNDPNSPLIVGPIAATRPVTMPASRSYPARRGHDQFYGYGRVNMDRAAGKAAAAAMPPEVEILRPDWWDQVDPARASLEIRGQLRVREGTYTCRVYVAPGSYPNNDTAPAGDFAAVDSDWCDGKTARGSVDDVKVADVDLAALKARFPANAGDFRGREPGSGTEQTANGRPNTEPYGFVVKVVAERRQGDAAITGEDRRNLHLHRDQDMLDGFPRRLPDDGAASPLLVDLDGDNRNELVIATSGGVVHAYRPDGSELPGWPVRGDRLALHTGGPAFRSGKVSAQVSGAMLASPAAADLDRDGHPEVVAADLEGKVYAWDRTGKRVLSVEAEPAYSGKPLAPFVDVRRGKRNRTQHGFIASPVLADLDGDDGGRLEVIAAGMDRHVYAWNHDGSPVPGFPVLVADRSKLAAIDARTHALTFKESAGEELNQGAIVDTPAVANLIGDGRPEIVVGTNEEYRGGDEGAVNTPDLSVFSALGSVLSPANSRLYAIRPEGEPGGPKLDSDPWVEGQWPVKVALLLKEVLPVVGEGITGAPAVGPASCPSGGSGPKVAAISAAGPGYVLNPDGSSCYGSDNGKHRTLEAEGGLGDATDKPAIPAFGHMAFGDFGGGTSVLAPAAGLIRALDVALNEYQVGGQDQVAAWNADSGRYRTGFPAKVNDLQFLTGPTVGDIDGSGGEEAVSGTASLDLAAFDGSGRRPSGRWPKLTSDWTVANPLLGSFGELETDTGTRKAIVALTRSGLVHAYRSSAPACVPASWPRFHHDNANSGDYGRDAVLPGKPMDARVEGDELRFRAPGDDLLCGRAARYEVVTSNKAIDGRSFEAAQEVAGAPAPGEPGAAQAVALTRRANFVAVRAVDEAGNVGPPAVVDTRGRGKGGR